MAKGLGARWVLTVLVALALLASPCLSLAMLVGSAPDHARFASAVSSPAEHDHAGAHAGHASHMADPGQQPEDGQQQDCCKLCDAWLSGRQDLAAMGLPGQSPAGPAFKPAPALPAFLPDRPRDARRLIALHPGLEGVPDNSPGPLYLTTGRFRV